MSEDTNNKKNKIVKIVAAIVAFLLALVGGYFGSTKLMDKQVATNGANANTMLIEENAITENMVAESEDANTTNTLANETENEMEEDKKAEEEKAKKEAEEKAAKEKAEKEKKEAEEKAAKEKEAKEKAEKEAAAKKAAEAAKAKQTTTKQTTTTSSTVATGKYKLADKTRDGTLTIKSATANSVNFSIELVNLFGGYHTGQLSGTAKKISANKYLYSNNQFSQPYKFYMQVNGNTIKVSTSKMLEADGWDPFCGANAVFDGTYKK